MNIIEALTQLHNEDVKELNIYWLEDIKLGESCWWIDVCEDTIDALCEMRWAWDILSKAEVDRERGESLVDYSDDEDECVIIVDEIFSEDVVKNAVEEWLRDRGFDFKINVIDPEGTDGMNQILTAIGDKDCYIKYPIDEIWAAEDAIEASESEMGL